MKSLIDIQTEYMETVSVGKDRWAHRRNGGHAGRIQTGAFRKAYKALSKIGFSDRQARQIIRDAHEMMTLERAAVDDDLNYAQD